MAGPATPVALINAALALGRSVILTPGVYALRHTVEVIRPGTVVPGLGFPTLVQDVFFRIGGATAGRATDGLVVNSSDVILDNIWAWRADHGTGVGWHDNVADTGLIVYGDDVTAYGLFIEHYGSGGTQSVVNGTGAPVTQAQPGPSDVSATRDRRAGRGPASWRNRRLPAAGTGFPCRTAHR